MASYSQEELLVVFERFSNFGAGSRNSLNSSFENLNGPLLDNAKFSKLCRDTKVIDGKTITSTDIDIVYNKVKPKGSRKITFENFQDILRNIAQQRFPKKDARSAYSAIVELIVNNGSPASNSTPAQVDGIFSKLTNVESYTGSHRERFNADGTGRGLQGRETHSSTDQLSKIVDRSSTNGTKRAANVVSISSERLDKASPKKNDVRSSTEKLGRSASVAKSNGSLNKKSSAATASNSSLTGNNYKTNGKSNQSVFDRLTDTQKYTGTHQHRFNADGQGKGMSGRDTTAKGSGTHSKYQGGDVKNLAQILRN